MIQDWIPMRLVKKFQRGDVVKGKVSRIEPYGAFLTLHPPTYVGLATTSVVIFDGLGSFNDYTYYS